MKERVTLTIDEDLLSRIDSTINHETIKNRSHAVELLLRKSLRGSVPKTAVILAGGMQTIGVAKTIKSMVLVQGKPVLLHNIELLKRYGVTDIIITISKGGGVIKRFFGTGEQFGVTISYVEEREPLGTAGCLRILKDSLTKPFLMLNGDELKSIDLEKFYEAHNQYQGVATIALTTTKDPQGYGVAMLDGNNILRFDEKPQDSTSMLINAGLYIMEPSVTEVIPEGFSMLEQEVFPVLAKEGKLFGYPFSGQWMDIHSEEDVIKAEKKWQR